MLITAGERKAVALMCIALADLGVPAYSFTGSQAGFLTDTNHTNAKIVEVRPDRVAEMVAAGRVPVVGERFETDGLDVEILEAERRRIHKLRIRKRREPADEASE